jgi:hypothetical protein
LFNDGKMAVLQKMFLFRILYYFISKMTVFWDEYIDLTMEAVNTSETSVNLYQTTLRNIPLDNQSFPFDTVSSPAAPVVRTQRYVADY